MISVIVPLYNKAPYITRCLQSISAQTLGDFEVIVVDDGSTDNGVHIAAAYPDQRVRVIRQKNGGPGRARNRGIAEANGDVLAFLDADDEWLPEFLAETRHALELAGPQAASATFGYIEAPANQSREALWRKRGIVPGPVRVDPKTPPRLLAAMLAYMSPCSTVARAGAVRRWGGFYDKEKCLFGEDAFLWLKVLLNETVIFDLRPLVLIHREASALSGNLPASRPVEPFLLYPDELRASCPREIQPLLEQLLTIRALKTSCVLGYWGQWRAAAALRSKFIPRLDVNAPLGLASLVCSTPVGATLGRAHRWSKRLRAQALGGLVRT